MDKDKIQITKLDEDELSNVTGGVVRGKNRPQAEKTIMNDSTNLQPTDLLNRGIAPTPTNMIHRPGKQDDTIMLA